MYLHIKDERSGQVIRNLELKQNIQTCILLVLWPWP